MMGRKNGIHCFYRGQPEAPCKDCPDRSPTCDQTCKKYKDFKQAMCEFKAYRKKVILETRGI